MAGAGAVMLHAPQALAAAQRGGVTGRIRGMPARRICLAFGADHQSVLAAQFAEWCAQHVIGGGSSLP